MSCDNTARLYDTSAIYILPVKDGQPVNISGATLYVVFQKPRTGTNVTVTGSPVVSGSNTYINYNCPSGFLDEIGRWQIEAQILSNSGSWRTDIGKLNVRRIL